MRNENYKVFTWFRPRSCSPIATAFCHEWCAVRLRAKLSPWTEISNSAKCIGLTPTNGSGAISSKRPEIKLENLNLLMTADFIDSKSDVPPASQLEKWNISEDQALAQGAGQFARIIGILFIS